MTDERDCTAEEHAAVVDYHNRLTANQSNLAIRVELHRGARVTVRHGLASELGALRGFTTNEGVRLLVRQLAELVDADPGQPAHATVLQYVDRCRADGPNPMITLFDDGSGEPFLLDGNKSAVAAFIAARDHDCHVAVYTVYQTPSGLGATSP